MAMSQERKGTIAVSLTNFLDSGCIVASSVALTAWARTRSAPPSVRLSAAF